MYKKRKFPKNVLGFFNPQKSGTNAVVEHGVIVIPGTHQREKFVASSFYKEIKNALNKGKIVPHVGPWL